MGNNYREVNLNDPNEMKTIAAIDMTIPAKFDSLFQVNEKTISERLVQLMKWKPHDFFEVAITENGRIVGYQPGQKNLNSITSRRLYTARIPL